MVRGGKALGGDGPRHIFAALPDAGLRIRDVSGGNSAACSSASRAARTTTIAPASTAAIPASRPPAAATRIPSPAAATALEGWCCRYRRHMLVALAVDH